LGLAGGEYRGDLGRTRTSDRASKKNEINEYAREV